MRTTLTSLLLRYPGVAITIKEVTFDPEEGRVFAYEVECGGFNRNLGKSVSYRRWIPKYSLAKNEDFFLISEIELCLEGLMDLVRKESNQ